MKVNLFVTCLIDQLFPHIGEAVVAVLERLGVQVQFLAAQTCCGQPAFNAGCRADARPTAARVLRIFSPELPLIIPSGSCTAMIRRSYRDLFPADSAERARLDQLLPNVFEFSEFLVDHLHATDVGASWPGRVAYHDSCHLLRELGIQRQPRELLRHVRGLELLELGDGQTCCGFGGLFSVKFPHVSAAMLRAKLHALQRSGAQALVMNDAGCLMQIAGGLSRRALPLEIVHLAEVLNRRES